MAKVTLKSLSHSYLRTQSSDADWAIRGVDIDWNDGGAYALLGPSGCGKTTLLNIISGLTQVGQCVLPVQQLKGLGSTRVGRCYPPDCQTEIGMRTA